jgi:hypothetical protein
MQSVKKTLATGKDSGNLSLSNQSTDRNNDMNIRTSTDGQFAELMGVDATDHDAHVMREMLMELGFKDTFEVPDHLWNNLLSAVATATLV